MSTHSYLVHIMRALSLSQELCSHLIPVETDQFLGEGADGDVYQIKDDPNKVIKFSKLYDAYSYKELENDFAKILAILSYLERYTSSIFAKVYSHGHMGTFDRNQVYYLNGKEFNRKQKFVLYYYIMEKLQKISDDEYKVFHSIISHEDRGYPKDYSIKKISNMIDGMHKGFDFDKQKVLSFCKGIQESVIEHHDIHERNIMKDIDGNFKLVDFDRASLTLIQ
jgi:thiamine kinase-like enzyme